MTFRGYSPADKGDLWRVRCTSIEMALWRFSSKAFLSLEGIKKKKKSLRFLPWLFFGGRNAKPNFQRRWKGSCVAIEGKSARPISYYSKAVLAVQAEGVIQKASAG